jgi:hypothetical protein
MSYLRDAIRFSQDHNACKLCRRKFDEHDHRDRDTFVTRVIILKAIFSGDSSDERQCYSINRNSRSR